MDDVAESKAEALERARAVVMVATGGKRSLVDELLAERRAEAKRE